MDHWPYCTGHPDCHSSRTAHYSWGGTTTNAGFGTPPDFRTVVVTLGERSDLFGERLCRAHALLRFNLSVG